MERADKFCGTRTSSGQRKLRTDTQEFSSRGQKLSWLQPVEVVGQQDTTWVKKGGGGGGSSPTDKEQHKDAEGTWGGTEAVCAVQQGTVPGASINGHQPQKGWEPVLCVITRSQRDRILTDHFINLQKDAANASALVGYFWC